MLHTMPARKSQLALKQKKDKPTTTVNGEQNMEETATNESNGLVEAQQQSSKKKSTPKSSNQKPDSTLSYSTLVIPKLITCVEIIKREWIKIQKTNIQKTWPTTVVSETTGAGEEKLAKGLQQYNEIACLEEVDDDDFVMDNQPEKRKLEEVGEEERAEMIVKLLSKKKL